MINLKKNGNDDEVYVAVFHKQIKKAPVESPETITDIGVVVKLRETSAGGIAIETDIVGECRYGFDNTASNRVEESDLFEHMPAVYLALKKMETWDNFDIKRSDQGSQNIEVALQNAIKAYNIDRFGLFNSTTQARLAYIEDYRELKHLLRIGKLPGDEKYDDEFFLGKKSSEIIELWRERYLALQAQALRDLAEIVALESEFRVGSVKIGNVLEGELIDELDIGETSESDTVKPTDFFDYVQQLARSEIAEQSPAPKGHEKLHSVLLGLRDIGEIGDENDAYLAVERGGKDWIRFLDEEDFIQILSYVGNPDEDKVSPDVLGAMDTPSIIKYMADLYEYDYDEDGYITSYFCDERPETIANAIRGLMRIDPVALSGAANTIVMAESSAIVDYIARIVRESN